MDIKRLQIEGGFLDGFDVRFRGGLNVLIGARGTGKTSVIELIRYALGTKNHTLEAAKRSGEHAIAVLDSGEVTITLDDVLDDVTVSRASTDGSPRANGSYVRPLIFSQTEIENLGLSEPGRLRLIDGFLSNASAFASEEAAAIAAIRSAFKEISAIEDERRSLAQGLEDLPNLVAQIQVLEAEEANHRSASSHLADKQNTLAQTTSLIARATVREQVLDRFGHAALRWEEKLSVLSADDFGPEEWNDEDGPDPLEGLRSTYLRLVGEVAAISERFDNLSASSATRSGEIARERMAMEARSRALRAEVEQSVSGAGAISRQLAHLQSQVAQLFAKKKIVEERDQRVRQLRLRRDERIKSLDKVRGERFASRAVIATNLNKALGPQIRVNVEQYGQYQDYTKALGDALRGSGMRYNDVVSLITKSVGPSELINLIDSGDYASFAKIAGISIERAARILGHLRETGAVDLVTVSIEDNVRLSLLDGVDYKSVEHLSAGQRCTVILSIVLQHTDRTLVIDQPEDHLDNAYIATTVVKAIRRRKGKGQLIISTHNANIPVLGGADLVVELTSDGRNGFVQVCDELTNSKAVDAITNVMEGGRAAFADRARFYDEHEL